MIRVKIELLPGGFDVNTQTIGEIIIDNDGSGTQSTGNYNVELLKSAKYSKSNAGKTYKKGTVKDFPRLKLGPYDLLYRALKNTIGFRNR